MIYYDCMRSCADYDVSIIFMAFRTSTGQIFPAYFIDCMKQMIQCFKSTTLLGGEQGVIKHILKKKIRNFWIKRSLV